MAHRDLRLPNSFIKGIITDIEDCKSTWFDIVVKSPLRGLLISLLKQYPEPKDLKNPNARVWLEIKEKFLKCEKIESIYALANLFFNVIIDEEEHDPPYEQRIDMIVKEVVEAVKDGRYILRDPLPTYSFRTEEEYEELLRTEKK